MQAQKNNLVLVNYSQQIFKTRCKKQKYNKMNLNKKKKELMMN